MSKADSDDVRLPPLDTFRVPLVVPLGHLVLQAAYFDNAFIEFIAMLLPLGEDTTPEQVAAVMRNWEIKFLHKAINDAVSRPDISTDLHAFVERIAKLRLDRHRMIHDAMEVSIGEKPGGGHEIMLLREGYERKDKLTNLRLSAVTPHDIGTLACAFYDARLEIDTFVGRFYDAGGVNAGPR
ncbi:MAG: hypothetical protein ABL866_12800 [Devosia sp.]